MKKLFILLMFIAMPCYGADYYIATTGSDSNDGSIGTPWATFTNANSDMSAGDTLHVRGGTYTESQFYWTRSGIDNNNHTIIKAYTGETPIISGNSGGAAITFWLGHISATNYVTFDGLTFDGMQVAVYMKDVSYILIKNCTFQNMTTTNTGAIVNADFTSSTSSSYITVENNLFKDMSGSQGNMVYFGTYADNVTVRYNTFQDGLQAAGVQLYHPSSPANLFTTFTIYNNIFNNLYQGIVLSSPDDVQIYNNTFYKWSRTGIQMDGGDGDCPQDVIIKNNIFSAPSGNSNGAIQLEKVCVDKGGNYIPITDYNLFHISSGYAFCWNSAGSSCGDSWNLTQYQANTAYGDNSVSGDPLFTTAGSDFTLQGGSPAIDAGTTIALVTDDYVGLTRPQNSVYDIGAYENAVSAVSLSGSASVVVTSNPWLKTDLAASASAPIVVSTLGGLSEPTPPDIGLQGTANITVTSNPELNTKLVMAGTSTVSVAAVASNYQAYSISGAATISVNAVHKEIETTVSGGGSYQ